MQKCTFFGVSVDAMPKQEIFKLCKKWLTESGDDGYCRQIATVNPEFLMEAWKNPEFLRVLQEADLRIADGFGLVCASMFLYGWKKKLFRMTGVELVDMLAGLCAETGKKIYLMGADPGVAEKAAQVLQKKFPLLKIAGAEEGVPKKIEQGKTDVIFLESIDTVIPVNEACSRPRSGTGIQSSTLGVDSGSRTGLVPNCDLGYGTTDEDLCTRISASGADVLLVAFGAPKQDFWIAENKERLSGVKIAIGVGGTFDYLAGVVPYAPRFLRTLGLEWLFRLMTQPHRLNRIITAVVRFPLAVMFGKLKK